MKKKFILCGLILGLGVFCYQSLPNWIVLKADSIPTVERETANYSEEDLQKVRTILEKPLRFLGHGSQCFAFTSEDETYVVKICRSSRYRCFKPSKAKLKKDSDFLSYVLAEQKIPDQSQVTFVHLTKTQSLNASIKMVDPWGFSHTFDADKTAFYIQRKAIPLPVYLSGLRKEDSKKIATQLLELFRSCCKVGLEIRDIYPKNIGLYKGEPLWIDPGRIREKPSLQEKEPQKKALRQFVSLLTPFLEKDFAGLLEEELTANSNRF